MTYAVKEIFATLQGEGANAGRVAVFVRFSGCNLWSGREQDRAKGPGGCSRWCDTDFVGTDGPGGGRFSSATALASAAVERWPSPEAPVARLVVLTGGEPLLQIDDALIEAFHQAGFEIAVETNGTRLPPPGIDWVCVSPKASAELALQQGNELKLVYPQQGMDPARFEHLDFDHFFLQPMDGPAADQNTESAVRYCLEHPHWRLSLQTHKLLGIP